MNSISSFVKKQLSFIKFFGKNIFKPFSLDLINKEHEKELRLKNEIFKKHSLKTIEKSKLVMQTHAAQLKLFDVSKEMDYINQRKLHQQRQLVESLNSLLSSIELDKDGYIINKKKMNGSTFLTKSQQVNDEASQKQQEQQQMKLNQSNIQQQVSINDLDSIFNEDNNNNTVEYIDPKQFDFDQVFKKPEPFSKEKYLKELEDRLRKDYNERKINISKDDNINNNINNNNNNNSTNNI